MLGIFLLDLSCSCSCSWSRNFKPASAKNVPAPQHCRRVGILYFKIRTCGDTVCVSGEAGLSAALCGGDSGVTISGVQRDLITGGGAAGPVRSCGESAASLTALAYTEEPMLRSSGIDLGSALRLDHSGYICPSGVDLGSSGVDLVGSSGIDLGSNGMDLGCRGRDLACMDFGSRGMDLGSPMPSSSKGKETSSELEASGDLGVPL